MSFPVTDRFSHVSFQLVAAGVRRTLCGSTGRGLLKLALDLLRAVPHAPFFADFAFYPFAVISHSHEYNYVLSCVDLLL